MLVSRIQEFLSRLSEQQNMLSQHDQELYQHINNVFSKINSGNEITEEQLALTLSEFYKTRWMQVVDDELDYTFNLDGINIPWIQLAKDIASILKLDYLQILIPVLQNDTEPDTFSRLSDLPNPHALYLGDDDKTWHRIKSLFNNLRQPEGLLATHDVVKSVKLRPLTIKELYRIKSKTGEDIAFEYEGKKYNNVWDYLVKKVATNWKVSEQYDCELLTDLFELADAYALDKNQQIVSSFHKKLVTLQLILKYKTYEDVRDFYSINFDYHENKIYLFEILVDCWSEAPDLKEKLIVLMSWLAKINPSIVSQNPLLESAYKEVETGPYFNINRLKILISQLENNSLNEELTLELTILKSALTTATEIKSEYIAKLTKIYAMRWNLVMDKADDYTRLQTGINLPWITLAQYLAGAGLINANYYRLLIPSLTHDVDFVTKENLTSYPLKDFIVSDEGTELIYLINSVERSKAKGTLLNCNPKYGEPFTLREKQRLQFAHKDYSSYYWQEEYLAPEPAISKQTVEKVKQFVNKALFPKGLTCGEMYNEDEQLVADNALVEFSMYLLSLSEQELSNLNKQRILYDRNRYSFADIMGQIQRIKDRDCIAVYCQYLMKLVIDYFPDSTFSSHLENYKTVKKNLILMRECSAKKLCSHWNRIDEKEAIRRSLIMMVSLMTHSFSMVFLTGCTVSIWDCTNKITKKGKKIFDALEAFMDSGKTDGIRYIYVSIIEKIVKPALSDQRMKTSLTRSDDTHKWLSCIGDGTLFQTAKTTCFEPNIFVVVLLKLSKSHSNLTAKLENFIEETLFTMAQPQNAYLIWVRVNINFTKWLQCVNESEQNLILTNLRSRTEHPEQSEVLEFAADFLLSKIARLSSKMNTNRSLFFPETKSLLKDSDEQEIKQKLIADFKAIKSSKDMSIAELIEKIPNLVAGLKIKSDKKTVNQYFNRMNGITEHYSCDLSLHA